MLTLPIKPVASASSGVERTYPFNRLGRATGGEAFDAAR
jgi:hypothetical protein